MTQRKCCCDDVRMVQGCNGFTLPPPPLGGRRSRSASTVSVGDGGVRLAGGSDAAGALSGRGDSQGSASDGHGGGEVCFCC